MADKFEQFTERARKVLTYAQQEARRFNHNYIGTEHILLGLVREGDGVGARVLASMDVDLPRVRQAIEYIIGRGASSPGGEIGLTPRAKKVIELAVDEARRLNHHYIGTEHLLLGLIREGEGIAAGVLESMGVRQERVRQAVLQAIREGGEPTDIEQQFDPAPLPPQGQENQAVRAGVGHEPALGDVRRVIAVNQTRVTDDIAVTILSIELYEHGIMIRGRMRGVGENAELNPRALRVRPRVRMLVDPNTQDWTLSNYDLSFNTDSLWFTTRDNLEIEIADGPLTLRVEAEAMSGTDQPAGSWELDIPL